MGLLGCVAPLPFFQRIKGIMRPQSLWMSQQQPDMSAANSGHPGGKRHRTLKDALREWLCPHLDADLLPGELGRASREIRKKEGQGR